MKYDQTINELTGHTLITTIWNMIKQSMN